MADLRLFVVLLIGVSVVLATGDRSARRTGADSLLNSRPTLSEEDESKLSAVAEGLSPEELDQALIDFRLSEDQWNKLDHDDRFPEWLNGSENMNDYPFCLNQCPSYRGKPEMKTCCNMRAAQFLAYLISLYPSMKADCDGTPCVKIEPEDACNSATLAGIAVDELNGCDDSVFGLTSCGFPPPPARKRSVDGPLAGKRGVNVDSDPASVLELKSPTFSVKIEAFWDADDNNQLGALRFSIAWLNADKTESWIAQGVKNPNFCAFKDDGSLEVCQGASLIEWSDELKCNAGSDTDEWNCEWADQSCGRCCEMCNGPSVMWGQISTENSCCIFKEFEFDAIGYKSTSGGKMCYDLDVDTPIPGDECLNEFKFDYLSFGHPDFFEMKIPPSNRGSNTQVQIWFPTLKGYAYLRSNSQEGSVSPALAIYGEGLNVERPF